MTQPERGMNEALPRAVLDSKGPESREPRKLPVKHRLGDERENIGRNPEAHGFSRWEEVTLVFNPAGPY